MLTSTQPQLFAIAPECTMSEILDVAQSIAIDRPEILRRIDADLDAAAIVKKRERQADAAWEREKRDGKISQDLAPVNTVPPLTTLAPHGGRPRTPAMIVLAGVFIRGQYGSLTAADVRDRLKDSSAFAALLWRFDLDNLEATVLARHVNNLSDGTIDLIFQAQIASFRREQLDDFELFSADSTSVRANAQWPNDSSLIYKLLRRAVSILCGFADDKKYCRLKTKLLVKWLEQLRVTARDIDLQAGKSNAIEARKKLYTDLVATARKLADRLGTQWDHVSDVVETIDLRPTDCRLRDHAIDDFVRCVADALSLIDYAEERTQCDPEVKRDEHEKITGIIERDAEIIKKGGREDQFGFKIQAAFSFNGVVTALIINKGNVSDSASLLPLLYAAVKRTGVT